MKIFSLQIKKYYELRNKKAIKIQISSCIKEYAKNIINWDGKEESKPREFLQYLGTDIIRKKIDPLFFIRRIIEDIKVYSYYFDVIIVSDVRFKNEIESIKKSFSSVYSIHITRPNYDNHLTIEQKNHPLETDLDDYHEFDYEIINDATIEDLNKKCEDLMKVIK